MIFFEEYVIIIKSMVGRAIGGILMIAGHLQHKKGYWYIVLNVPNESGRHSPKWFSTGLKVKGNKGKAEELLIMKRIEYSKAEERQHELIKRVCFGLDLLTK